MTKTYKLVGIGGKYSIYVRYGKGGKQVTFTRHYSDLTYTTDDEDLQNAIENTNEFKRGIIVVEDVSGEPKAKSQGAKKQEQAGGKEKPASNDTGSGGTGEETVEGPTTVQEAKEWLKTNKGIQPVALNSLEKVKKQAEKAGVVFPNVAWPE